MQKLRRLVQNHIAVNIEIEFKHGCPTLPIHNNTRKQNLTKNQEFGQMSLIFPKAQLGNTGFNHLLPSGTLNRPRKQNVIYFL